MYYETVPELPAPWWENGDNLKEFPPNYCFTCQKRVEPEPAMDWHGDEEVCPYCGEFLD